MTEIKTNDRFDKLTNNDISTHYKEVEVYLFPSCLTSALAYWITKQNPNKSIIELKPILLAYKNYIIDNWENPLIPEIFTFDSLQELISEPVFASIPEMLELNNMLPDFIDLYVLARNVFYMILREQITQA